jgi:chorismate mutase
MVRGIRGATTTDANDAAEIVVRTQELLNALLSANGALPEEIASAIFTVTDDLDAAFPAVAARHLAGWENVPLLCAREIVVPGSPDRCIRVLLHWNTELPAARIQHAYLRGARALRPEWAADPQ